MDSNPKSDLVQFCTASRFGNPAYNNRKAGGSDHSPLWECVCTVAMANGGLKQTTARAGTIKRAETDAAVLMMIALAPGMQPAQTQMQQPAQHQQLQNWMSPLSQLPMLPLPVMQQASVMQQPPVMQQPSVMQQPPVMQQHPQQVRVSLVDVAWVNRAPLHTACGGGIGGAGWLCAHWARPGDGVVDRPHLVWIFGSRGAMLEFTSNPAHGRGGFAAAQDSAGCKCVRLVECAEPLFNIAARARLHKRLGHRVDVAAEPIAAAFILDYDPPAKN